MQRIVVCCVDISRIGGDDGFDGVLVGFFGGGVGGAEVCCGFVVAFRSPGDVVDVCELSG